MSTPQPKMKSESSSYIALTISKLRINERLPVAVYVYMPGNDKMLIYRPAGSVLEQTKFDQMQAYADRFFIRAEDAAALDEALKAAPKTGTATIDNVIKLPVKSEDQKKELQLKSAELLFKSLSFTIDSKSSLSPVEQANKHISGVVTEVLDVIEVDAGLLEKVRALQKAMQGQNWDHALNVAAISALLAMSIGYTDKKLLRDIATGGYLHDIGLGACNLAPPKRELQYNDEEMVRYKEHPRLGFEMIENLELPVSEEVKLIVYQHEEKYEGGGFPMGVSGNDIFEPAQIVAIAGRLDDLMRVDEPGWIAPDAALRLLCESNTAPGKPSDFNPILLQQIFESSFSAGAVKLED